MDLRNGWLLPRDDGLVTRIYDGEGDGEFVSSTYQHFGNLLDRNAEERAARGEHRSYKDGMGEKVASIPLVVYTDLKQRGIADDPIAFKEWLDDPANAVFRTNDMALTKRAMQRKYGV